MVSSGVEVVSSGVERCRAVSSGVERCRVWHLDTGERGTSLDGVDGVEGCRGCRVGMGCRGVELVSSFGVEVSRPGLSTSTARVPVCAV